MRIVCYYNKNLKMSDGKLAAQIGHVMYQVGQVFSKNPITGNTIIVLGLRQNKFISTLKNLKENDPLYLFEQKDLGLTEVSKGTVTAFGYIE